MESPKAKQTLLVIDDDRLLCDVILKHFADAELDVVTAHTASQAVDIYSRKIPDVVLLDQKLPDRNGVELCPMILERNEHAKVIFVTAYPNLENAIAAVKVGAYDYLLKPFDMEELNLAIARALRTLKLENIEQLQAYYNLRQSENTFIAGRKRGLAGTWNLIEKAAATQASVLITGETGVGKNVVAKSIHYMGPVAKTSFIDLNCAAIPAELIESELFGHERGAFTGAVSARKGIFEIASGGTLFLDEIGTLPLHLQAKLLGVLDEQKIRRVGGESARAVNVRIVAATNANLEKAVRDGKFREDLYYRLNVIRIHLPPLRNRLQDIPELCSFFVNQIAPDSGLKLPDFELAKLMQYRWPGNIRELKNIIERSIILRKNAVIYPSKLLGATCSEEPESASPDRTQETGVATLAEIELNHITHALHRLGGNRTKAAAALGISRSTLKRKLRNRHIQ